MSRGFLGLVTAAALLAGAGHAQAQQGFGFFYCRQRLCRHAISDTASGSIFKPRRIDQDKIKVAQPAAAIQSSAPNQVVTLTVAGPGAAPRPVPVTLGSRVIGGK